MPVATDLLDVLAGQRLALEALVYKLLQARWTLAAGETRFLGWAADDLAGAADNVEAFERARLTAAVSATTGFSVTLRQAAATLPEPHSAILAEHGGAIGRLRCEVAVLSGQLRQVAAECAVVGMDDLDRELVAMGRAAVLHAARDLSSPGLDAFLLG